MNDPRASHAHHTKQFGFVSCCLVWCAWIVFFGICSNLVMTDLVEAQSL